MTACKACGGSGYIREIRIINNMRYDFAHVCPCCDNGQEYDGESGYYCHKYQPPVGGTQ